MSIKTWLKNQNSAHLSPGDTVYIIHRDNNGLSLLTQKVKTIGTKYITTCGIYERRFETGNADQYLIEKVSIGHPGYLYLTKDEAVEYLHAHATKKTIRQNLDDWLQNASNDRIYAAALILSGEASDTAVATFLNITKHE